MESLTARSKQVGFVPCDHEYLNFKGGKFSNSQGGTVDVPYFLSKYDPDPLRFYPTAKAPEARDTEAYPWPVEGFSWEDFVERNNYVLSKAEENELVAPGGNQAKHILPFAHKRFDGKVPEPGELDDEDRALLEKVEAGFETVGDLYNACKLRAAPSALLRAGLGEALAPEENGYVDRRVPRFQI